MGQKRGRVSSRKSNRRGYRLISESLESRDESRMARYFQFFHRSILPVLFPLIAFDRCHGHDLPDRAGWFGMERKTGDLVLDIHTGGWMGDHLSSVYVYLVGLSLIAALLTGATYLLRRGGGAGPASVTVWWGWFFLLPLFITATTGVLHEAGETWLPFPESFLKLLMNLHEGRWLGKEGRVYYVIVVGGALLGLGILGLSLWRSGEKRDSLPAEAWQALGRPYGQGACFCRLFFEILREVRGLDPAILGGQPRSGATTC